MKSKFLVFLLFESIAFAGLKPDLSLLPLLKAPIILTTGEQRLLRVPGLKRYSLGSNSVRIRPVSPSGSPDSESLLMKAVHPGRADLWVWKEGGGAEHRSITVLKSERTDRGSPLERALGNLDEVEVLRNGERVTLRGPIISIREASRISAIIKAHPNLIADETELSAPLLDQAETSLTTWLRRTGYSNQIRVERIGDVLWIRGSLARAASRASVERQIRAIFPQIEFALEALPDDSPTIHFRVYLLELKKSAFGAFGLRWPGTQEGAFKVSPWNIQQRLQLDLALEAMEGTGNARILSKPELAVRAPGEAELFSGGEFPIRTHTPWATEVNWKPFGLLLKLKVTHIAGERVRVDIATEVSHLDPKITDEPIPGVNSNRMKTQVDAQFGVPLFLSGLLQEGMRKQARGIPLLRKIPVLGALFGSEDYLNERSELVAILLPSAAPPTAPMTRVQAVQALMPWGKKLP